MEELQRVLQDRTQNHFMPFLWYAGEKPEVVCRTLEEIRASGIRGITLENRGGNWFNTQRWWDLLEKVFAKAEQLGMEVWMLDDSHVGSGSANDTLKLPENEKFRPKNLRIEAMDVVGPQYGAAFLPKMTEAESLVSAVIFKRNPDTGVCYGEGRDVTAEAIDGLLPLELSEGGLWRIYFVVNADPKCQGFWYYYVSMLSKDSCRHLIDEVLEKMYQHCGQHFGKTFKGFFTDEPGFGNCNGEYDEHCRKNCLGNFKYLVAWWDDMPSRLAKELGESEENVMRNIAALWDDIDGKSDRYRLAYMNVITGLWRENYTMQVGDWCRAHNVQYIGHYLEDDTAHLCMGFGCGHLLRTMDGQDMAGIDYVLNQITPGITSLSHTKGFGKDTYNDSRFYVYTLPRLGSTLAHHNSRMKGRYMAELMGAYGWSAGLSVMRYLFNHSMVNGVNYYVPHAFSMVVPSCFKKGEERNDTDLSSLPPGYCMTFLAPSFHGAGFNPQYGGFARLVAHVQRISDLLLTGRRTPDVAVYYNAESFWMDTEKETMTDAITELVRANLDVEVLSLDMLRNAEVQNGRLSESGISCNCLVIPAAKIIPSELSELILRFAKEGLPIVFVDKIPQKTELGEDLRLQKQSKLEGARLSCVPLNECPQTVKAICPPFVKFSDVCKDLQYYTLAKDDGSVLVLFMNEGFTEIDVMVDKPVKGGAVLYDSWNNKAFAPLDNGDAIRLKLRPQQLLAVWFGVEGANYPAFKYDLPEMKETPLQFTVYMQEAGKAEKEYLCGPAEPCNLLKEMKMTRACATFFYEADFYCDGEYTVLEVPATGDFTALSINGEEVGADFGPSCVFDISGKLKQGKNHITIVTEDNPSYVDREKEYGTKLPLQPHGIAKNIKLG